MNYIIEIWKFAVHGGHGENFGSAEKSRNLVCKFSVYNFGLYLWLGRQAAKRKRYVESSEEETSEEEVENEEDEEDEETEDEDSKPPPRKALRTSRGRAGKGGRKISKNSESPKNETGRLKGRRSAPSPETVYESRPKISRRAPSELSVSLQLFFRKIILKKMNVWIFSVAFEMFIYVNI